MYNQHILKTTVANVSKGQTGMSHKGELQTLTLHTNGTIQFNSIQNIFNSDKRHEYYIIQIESSSTAKPQWVDLLLWTHYLKQLEHIVAIDPSNYLII